MDDKEVGDCWKEILTRCGQLDGCPNHGETIALIRKLVEERIRRYTEGICRHRANLHRDQALYEFGIDLAEWKED